MFSGTRCMGVTILRNALAQRSRVPKNTGVPSVLLAHMVTFLLQVSALNVCKWWLTKLFPPSSFIVSDIFVLWSIIINFFRPWFYYDTIARRELCCPCLCEAEAWDVKCKSILQVPELSQSLPCSHQKGQGSILTTSGRWGPIMVVCINKYTQRY